MMDAAAEVEENIFVVSDAKLHGQMCKALSIVYCKVLSVFPSLEAARPRSKTGIQALCSLHVALEKAKNVLHHCSVCSKLYLAVTGDSVLLKFEKAKCALEDSLRRVEDIVPQSIGYQVQEIVNEFASVEFALDPLEKQVGDDLIALLQQGKKFDDDSESYELESFHQAATRLGITSSRAALAERRALKKVIDKARAEEDKRKESIVAYLLHLMRKYSKLFRNEFSDDNDSQGSGPCSPTVQGSNEDGVPVCHSQAFGRQLSKLSSFSFTPNNNMEPGQMALPPEELRCPISLHLMYDPAQTCHPLDPLSAAEISVAVSSVRAAGATPEVRDSMRFVEVVLVEPVKQVVALADAYFFPPFQPSLLPRTKGGGPLIPAKLPNRKARLVVYNKRSNETSVWIVELREVHAATRGGQHRGKVISSEVVPNVQPPMDAVEYAECEAVVKDFPPFREAMKRRGIEDMDLVMVDAWCVGYHSEADAPNRRLAKPLIFCRCESDCPMENGYARPVEGIYVLVDMQNMVILEFEDRKLIPLPPIDPLRNYSSGETRGGVDRSDVKPLQIIQPEGPSFRVNGHFIQWQKWNFRIGFTPREGLVIYSVAYIDGSQGRRPVAHRLSFVEMVVPYGDPNDPHYRKIAFDAGEDGLGKNAQSLKKGCDCLGYIKYFDAHFTNFTGGVETIENCVCMHEEDHGILWKHQDWRTGLAEVRRSRRLTVSFICTVANYEYGFFWYFYQDGKIEAEVKITGILSLGVMQPGETRKYGTTIAPGLYAPVHQHFFVARMDMAVDCKPGEAFNQVVEVDVKVEDPGQNNVHNNAFYAEEKLLKSELEAMRDCNPLSARHWIVRNTRTVNRTGQLTGYRLVPGSNCLPLAGPEAMFLRRAAFLKHNLWVTPYVHNEMHPGGEFPNQNPRVGEGLATWVKENRSLEEADIVLWYVFGVTFIPRLEDWPVMPVERIGFMLMPHGFFNCSPAIDVPPSAGDLDDKEIGMPAKSIQNELIAKL